MTGPPSPVSVGVDCPAKTNLTLRVGQARAEWGNRHCPGYHLLRGEHLRHGHRHPAKRPAPGSRWICPAPIWGIWPPPVPICAATMRFWPCSPWPRPVAASRTWRSPSTSASPSAPDWGGGSADAAATLLALNTLWGLDWPLERLREVAAGLGADMPFCLSGGYAHGTGFGERITPLEEDRIRQLRDSVFAGPLGGRRLSGRTAHARGLCDLRRVGRRPATMTTICSAPPSRCIRAAVRPCAPRCRPAPRMPSSPVPAPRWWAFAPDAARLQAIANAWRESAAVDRIIAADAPATPKVHVHTA